MRRSYNRFVAVTDADQIVGLVAAKNRQEAEEDFASLGLTGTVYSKQEFKQTVHYQRAKLERKRQRIISRIKALTARFDDYRSLQYVAEAILTPEGRRKRQKFLTKLDKLQWVLQATEEQLENYDPDLDPDLRDDE